jgi:hypothetical protein
LAGRERKRLKGYYIHANCKSLENHGERRIGIRSHTALRKILFLIKYAVPGTEIVLGMSFSLHIGRIVEARGLTKDLLFRGVASFGGQLGCDIWRSDLPLAAKSVGAVLAPAQ